MKRNYDLIMSELAVLEEMAQRTEQRRQEAKAHQRNKRVGKRKAKKEH